MSRKTTLFRTFLATLITVLAFTAIATAQTSKQAAFSNIHIKNFGQMDARFYRGAQPKEQDYKDLAALGVKTIIDLREDPTSYERRDSEALGMRYINIPMVDKAYPPDSQVQEFLKIANDPATGPFFVHCAGGRHRTGIMGAVYRFTVDHWNFDQAYSEMKTYDFYTSWGHGDQKKFVEDYWARIQANPASASITATATGAPK
jgi:protein tyrosine/serine phosphatase